MRDTIESRALSLYRSHGFRPDSHPGMVRLASAALGEESIQFVSSASRGSMCSIAPDGTWSIHLIDGAPDHVQVLTIARCLARWEAAQRPGLSREQVGELALAILCPAPLMRHARDRHHWSVEQIAAMLVAPVEVVHIRSAAVRPLRSVRKTERVVVPGPFSLAISPG